MRDERAWHGPFSGAVRWILLFGTTLSLVLMQLEPNPPALVGIPVAAVGALGPPVVGAWFGFVSARRYGLRGVVAAVALVAAAAGAFTAVFFQLVVFSTGMEGIGLVAGWVVHGAAAVAAFGGTVVALVHGIDGAQADEDEA